jgi:two-component system, NtrC family, C4-dicarboxylate transport response regulator DctD
MVALRKSEDVQMKDTRILTPDRGSRDRVLVVDDEPLIRWSLSETLGHVGFTVVEAGDARTAMGEASDPQKPFAVAVLDVRLPDSDGLGLLMRLRRLMPDTRIILMTAHGSPELAQSALDLGAYRVLDKPFGMSEIADIVDQASHEYPTERRIVL